MEQKTRDGTGDKGHDSRGNRAKDRTRDGIGKGTGQLVSHAKGLKNTTEPKSSKRLQSFPSL